MPPTSKPTRSIPSSSQSEPIASGGSPITSALLLLLIYSFAFIWVLVERGPPLTGFAEAEKAPATIVAAVDFTCVDLAKTEMEQAQAERRTPPVFMLNTAPQSFAIRTLDKLFERLIHTRSEAVTVPGTSRNELASTLDVLGVPLSVDDFDLLAPVGSERETQDAIRSALRRVWQSGIISDEDRQSRFGGIAADGVIVIKYADGLLAPPVSLDRVLTPDEAVHLAVQEVRALNVATNASTNALSALLRTWLAPNLLYDPLETAENRRAARNAVAPLTMPVKAGTTLVESGQRLSAQQAAMLAAHASRLSALESSADRMLRRVGIAGFLLMGLLLCVVLSHLWRPQLIRENTNLVLWLLLTVITLLLAEGTSWGTQLSPRFPSSAVSLTAPVAFAPLVTAMLLGSRAAWIIGVWTSFCLAAFLRNDFALLPYGCLVSAVTAHGAHRIRKRSQIYRAGLVAGLVGILHSLVLGTMHQQLIETTIIQATMGLVSGVLCGFLVALLIPLLEWMFRITTDLTLLELSDLSHPLLQRLAMEAPGTYHHSMVAAHLGEAAATRIGANALLMRVATYFHDIGKLTKPDFYIENTTGQQNPHDQLSPEMSALLIRSHVQEGLILARRYNLPACIQDAIVQHHGTGLISYFYRQALQNTSAESPQVNEAHFRYDGPLPQTREMGLLMLADAVEAAVRSLERPDEERIQTVIYEITEAKIKDGQLDACLLSLAEIHAVRESFAFTLANMLHVRIPYPNHDKSHPDQPAEMPERNAPTTQTARAVAGEPKSETRPCL